MKIYVDFDDCLCETARFFSAFAAELFGKDVPYEEIRYFDLRKSFGLTGAQYDRLMAEGHEPDRLLSYEETPGASETVNGWLDRGYDVSVITGRPYSTYGPSRTWLDRHGLERAKLYCLDKYGRDSFLKDRSFSLELPDFYRMKFDYAVEDSPLAFRFFNHLPDLRVLVFDRPWNRGCEFPGDQYCRCGSWDIIREKVRQGQKDIVF